MFVNFENICFLYFSSTVWDNSLWLIINFSMFSSIFSLFLLGGLTPSSIFCTNFFWLRGQSVDKVGHIKSFSFKWSLSLIVLFSEAQLKKSLTKTFLIQRLFLRTAKKTFPLFLLFSLTKISTTALQYYSVDCTFLPGPV